MRRREVESPALMIYVANARRLGTGTAMSFFMMSHGAGGKPDVEAAGVEADAAAHEG